MSQKNVEVLRMAYAQAAVRGAEGMLDVVTEDVVWMSDPQFPDGGRT